MSVNILGARKTRAVARATGLPVVWAFVHSSGDAGRHAWFTTADHRHGVLGRRSGEWRYDDGPCRQWSCRVLFAGEVDQAALLRRADGMRRGTVS